jgi:hypothetical protein
MADGSELERLCLDVIARCSRVQQRLCAVSDNFDPGMLDAERRQQIREDTLVVCLAKAEMEFCATQLHRLQLEMRNLG